MGVTVHFSGRLKSEDAFDSVMIIAKDFAEGYGLSYALYEETDKLLLRVKDEKDWDYQGPVKGMRIELAESAEPVLLEFDENLIIQEYCKTQFAGAEVHLQLIDLLKSIKPEFENMVVDD